MSLILSTTEKHEDQKLEIFVKYDKDENEVLEIKSVFIDSPVGMIPVGCLFMSIPEMDVAINKIIDRTDWHDIYRQMCVEMEEAA
jgi:hypothetical protein